MRYTEMIKCRLSLEQKKLIVKDIQDNYPTINLSEYIRNKVMGKPMDARKVIILLSDLKYEINRIGNNLNQITHKLNSGDYGQGDMERLHVMQEEIISFNKRLMDIENYLMKSGEVENGDN